jgi:hypothetical protein
MTVSSDPIFFWWLAEKAERQICVAEETMMDAKLKHLFLHIEGAVGCW